MISIIIPTHNRRNNIECVLTSLANQTQKPDEVIVVDDRSTDRTGHAVLTFSEFNFPVKYVYNPPTHNQWNASIPRNLGARVARKDSEILWFLDSDVILPKDAVEKTVQAYMAGDHRRVMIGSYHWLPAQVITPKDVTERFDDIIGGLLPTLIIQRRGMIGQRDIRQVSFDKAVNSQETFLSFTDGLACFGGYLLIPKQIFFMSGGYDETILAGCEDGDFGITLYEMGVPFSYLKETCGHHMAHEQPDGRDPMTITQQVKRLNEKHNVDMIHQSGKAYRQWGIDWSPDPSMYDYDEKKLAEYKRNWKLDRIDLTLKITKQ